MKGVKKPMFIYSIMLLFVYVMFKFNENVPNERFIEVIRNINKFIMKENKSNDNMINEVKYILHWTSLNSLAFPYVNVLVYQEAFKDIHCAYTNCYITVNRSYLRDYTKFDVIVFDGPEVVEMSLNNLPKKRSLKQKFVFATKYSADDYPICSNKLNGYFNWTWTYRLDSDASWGSIVVTNSEKQIIGPKDNMNWIQLEDMKPINKKLRDKLKKKTKAAVWFQSNYHARSGSTEFVKNLRMELKKFKLNVDIHISYNLLSCPFRNRVRCNKMIETDYFFYLSFENSFAEDYVTEQLLYPLQNLAVPIVYGGANYTRFMADGTYINARELGPQMLAEKMNTLIRNQDEYRKYFKWSNYYSYYKRIDTLDANNFCRFCYLLNEEETIKKTTVYESFREWWDPPGRC